MRDPPLDVAPLLGNALHHLETALHLLDQAAAPAHIAAYVDMAASQLSELLGSDREPGGSIQIE